MKTSHTYCILYCGAVLLLLGYVGVCVLAEERTPLELRAAGSSFILPLGYPTDSVSFAQWTYNTKSFAIYRNKKLSITNELQFSGRLKVNSDDLSVEVMNLQLSDSGSYTIVTQSSSGEQLPTKTIILTVYADETPDTLHLQKYALLGSTVSLSLQGHTQDLTDIKWRKGKLLISISKSVRPEFIKRFHLNVTDNSLIIENVTMNDSGHYRAEAGEWEKTILDYHLIVENVINVEIESKQTWKAATNSCDVSLLCRAPEGQTVFYRWRGFKEEDGAQLNFILTPEDGDVTLNCTAVGRSVQGSNSTRVKCKAEKTSTDTSGYQFSVLHLLSFLMAASPYLLSTIILGVKHYRARGEISQSSSKSIIINTLSASLRLI